MPGTKIGGIKAAATNKAKYGEDFYVRNGAKGGSAPYKSPRGFAANKEIARSAGRLGGTISRRKPANKAYNEETTWNANQANSASSESSTSTNKTCDICKQPYKGPGIVKGYCSTCAPDFHDDEANRLARALIQPKSRWWHWFKR
jgi:hypothetical protein